VEEYLSEREHVITVLEMQDEVAKDLVALRKISVVERLAADGVILRTNAKCTAISKQSVTIEVERATEEIPADSVVVAVGAKSRSSEQLKEKSIEAGIPCHIIGDAVSARRALNATAEATEIARVI
jgi:NADH dehydrogenase FAD-containing subunit